MRRFHEYARQTGGQPDIEVDVIPGTFELVMAGKTEEYTAAVIDRLREIVRSGRYQTIAVGQLSMAHSAICVAAEIGMPVGNPLQSLAAHLASTLGATTAAS